MEAEGIKPLDALHAACAESAGSEYFLTCDDQLVKQYKGRIQVLNPVNFVFFITGKGNEH